MTNLNVNFLHLFFLLLSLGAMDQANAAPTRGARAAPALPSTVPASPSRRGSIAIDSAGEEASPAERRGSILNDRRLSSISSPSGRRMSSVSVSSDLRRESLSGTPLGRRMSSVSVATGDRVRSVSNASGRRMSSLSIAPDLRRSALFAPSKDIKRKASGLLSSIARDIGVDDDDDDDGEEEDDDDDEGNDPDSSIVHFPVIKGRNFSGTQGVSLGLRELDSKQGAHPQMLLQHHLNTANAKLARMTGRDPVTEEDRVNALARRRESILEDVQRRSLQEPRKVHSGRFGFAPTFAKSKKGEDPSRRDYEPEEPDPLTPNANPMPDPFDAAATEESSNLDHVRKRSYNIAKYGFPKAALTTSNSDVLMKAEKPSHDGSLGLRIEANDIGYIANVAIGKAGVFKMLIDSGSADTWVPSTACDSCGDAHKALGPSTSSTFETPAKQRDFSIVYGTGSLSGHTAQDSLTIGGYTLRNQVMGVATKQSIDFSSSDTPFDGLMGFAQRALSSTDAPTPIDSLFSKGLVSQPVMGYHLGRSADSAKNNDGEVTFGGVNGDKYKGDLTVIKNHSTAGFWEAEFAKVTFGGKEINLPGTYERSAILDTGTTLIVAPQADADALHAAIPGSKADGSGGYTIPCTTSKSVAFNIGGKNWEIDPRDMLFLPVDSNDLTGDCVSAVSAGSIGTAGQWLFGAAFLKNVYFATNTDSNTLALGELSDD